MSNLKKITVNGREVVFVSRSENTNYGFRHISEMFIDGISISEGIRQYYNRTWERYEYQSAMQTAVYNLINENRKTMEHSYRLKNSIKRMTKKHSDILESIFIKDDYIIFLEKIIEEL